ncbi:MAG: GAF domain-containing protein [Anaerolineae bacterium]|nr:GAF domain-containing protein [Anaerolineae bacterium]
MTTSQPALRFLQQENVRLQEENRVLQAENGSLQSYLRTMGELYAIAQRLEEVDSPLDLLDELLYKTMRVIGAVDGSISRLDRAAGELEFVLVHGDIRQELRGYRIQADAGVAGWVVSQGEPLIVNNPRQDWRFSLEVDQEFNFVTRSIVCVPIMTPAGLVGVIELLNKPGDTFTETDVAVLSMLSGVAAKVLAAG